MAISMYTASIPVFKQMLGSLDDLLNKAKIYCEERKIDQSALLQARLFPDMFPLSRQIQIACDFARSVSARLAGIDVPTNEDKEQTFEDLQALIARTNMFLDTLKSEQFQGSEEREIVTRPGTPKEKKFTGQSYLLSYGLPQFFFHVTTTYALLRHSGLSIGKRDYMGQF